MEKKHQRGARKDQAERNHCKGVPKQHPLQTPGGFMPMPKKRDRRREDESRRWRDGD